MKIIKRNGAEVPFDITKIITAVTKASDSVGGQSSSEPGADHPDRRSRYRPVPGSSTARSAWKKYRIWWRTS